MTTATATPTIQERVAAGAAWMDEHVEGWRSLVDTDELRMQDGDHCIGGQAFHATDEEGTEYDGYSGLLNYATGNEGVHPAEWNARIAFAFAHGFTALPEESGTATPAQWDELTRAWQDELAPERETVA